MLRRIKIENIRSISSTDFSLKKMNVFIGKNSSGKSSILSALLGLRALTLDETELPAPFKDLNSLCRRGSGRVMSIELTGSGTLETLDDITSGMILSAHFIESGAFAYELMGELDGEVIGLSEIAISATYHEDIINDIYQYNLLDSLSLVNQEKMRLALDSRSPNIGVSYLVGADDKDITHGSGHLRFLGYSFKPFTRDSSFLEEYFFKQRRLLFEYFTDMVFISVQRGFFNSEYPLRDEVITSLTGDKVSPEEILNIQAYRDHRDPEATKKMAKWAKEFGIDDFETENQPRRLIVGRGSIKTEGNEEQIPVSLFGFGSNQFLTVIAKCVFAPKNAPILIEEPEIHLHPQMQASATDFLIEQMKEGHQLFITTHSEHLIGRIQRRIAEKTISNEDVGIFWVKYDSESGTIVEEVSMDEDGVLHEELKTYMDFLEEEISATRAARQLIHDNEG